MHTWIALIRGINVGGHNLLPMKELAKNLQSLNSDSVRIEGIRTYLQSGNVVFQSSHQSASSASAAISQQIERCHGFRPQVLILSADELSLAIKANPFPEAESDPTSLHLFILDTKPTALDHAGLEAAKSPTERFALKNRSFYLHAPDGIGRSKLASRAERLLGVVATARNWRTVQQLSDMVAKQ